MENETQQLIHVINLRRLEARAAGYSSSKYILTTSERFNAVSSMLFRSILLRYMLLESRQLWILDAYSAKRVWGLLWC